MKKIIAIVLILATLGSSLSAKVVVVLSGGGARGIAHIAILEALEEQGIPIDMVIGTSMGALVGGLYAAGYSPGELRTLMAETDLLGLFVHSPLTGNRRHDRPFSTSFEPTFSLGFSSEGIGDTPAILGDQRILELLGFLLSKYPNDIDFDQLPIPFRAVSTDVASAERVVHDRGSLVQAIRSSIAIPIVFSPFPTDDRRLLLDGGLVDNLPIALARDLGATYVIASDVNAEMVDDLSQLESLSAIAMQAVVLATRAKAITQYEQADLLYKIPLKQYNALDFIHWNEILKTGEETAAEMHEQLRALASLIEEEHPLQPHSADRLGRYVQMPPPMIKRVEVRDISTTPMKRPLEAKTFEHFVGKLLDWRTNRELNLLLRELRVVKGLSSLSYEMGEEGTLIILQRGFGKPLGEVFMGFSSDTGFSNALASSISWFRADAYLGATVEEFLGSPLTLKVSGQLGSKSDMRLGISYPYSFSQHGALDVDFSVGYLVGGLTALSAPTNANRSAPLDRVFTSLLGISLSIGDRLQVYLDGVYDFAFLHNQSYDPQHIYHGRLQSSLLYSTLLNHFSMQGIRLEVLNSIGFHRSMTWASRVSFVHKIPIGLNDSLRYDLAISMIREPYPLITSYADTGSLDGIPGYAPLSLHRDLAMVGIGWDHRLFEILGYPTFLRLIARGGIFDGYNPYAGVKASTDKVFDQLMWDLGFGVGVGLAAPIGEVSLSFGVTITGKMTFMIGIH